MNFRAVNGYHLVRQDSLPTESPSGLTLRIAMEKTTSGVVEHASTEYIDDGVLVVSDIREGDRVVFTRHTGTELTVNDEKLLAIRESDIIGLYRTI